MFGKRNVYPGFRGLLLLAALLVNTAAQAQSSCQRWDVGDHITLIQSNNTAADLRLKQTPSGFSGDASFGFWTDDDFWLCNIGSCGKDYHIVRGPVVGTVNGDMFEATVYWDNNAIGVYTGRIGAQGLIVGNTYDKNDPSTRADWHSNRVLECAAAKTGMALGRVHLPAGTATPGKSICDYAKSARERNSPAAPSLEKQCAEQGGPPPPKALGRVKAPPGTPPSPPRTMCEMAASARARNSPTAPALEQRCREEQAAHAAAPAPVVAPAPAPVPAPAPSPPVQKPHDLMIGRISIVQEGQRGKPVRVGIPATIECTYRVAEAAGPFVFQIRPWRGSIQVGGQDPQTFSFQGELPGGPHAARQAWTPSIADRTPISCILNPGFEDAEANPGNNRSNEVVNVVDAGNADNADAAQAQ